MQFYRLLLLTFTFMMSSSLCAATPVGPMSYQGRLLDNNGVPVSGAYDFKVNIHNDPANSSLQYYEEHLNIQVDDGVYSFKVGTGTNVSGPESWDTDLWQGNLNDLYLELAISVYNAGNFETLTPRHELTSAPHAFTATLALSLGGRTIEEFDNILEGVCVASKGKWLELADKCLGAGASFPGPSTVAWNTLSSSNDFKNLDLTNADVSGIIFLNANLSGSIFNGTTYSVENMSGADLSNSQWDGATSTDSSPYTVAATTKFNNAAMKNMDMSKWNLSLPTYLNYKMFSAAYLSQCPDALFTDVDNWECRYMRGTSGNYFLAGSYANFSTTSAVATTLLGDSFLDIDDTALDNIPLRYASFVGVTLTQGFLNCSLYQADLSYATLRKIQFSGNNFAGSKFVNTHIVDVIFLSDIINMNLMNMAGASMERVDFQKSLTTPTLTGASLRQVDLISLGGAKLQNASLEDVRISSQMHATTAPYDAVFDGTIFYSDFYTKTINSPQYFLMNNISFNGSHLTGSLKNLVFTGTISFQNVTFEDIDLTGTNFPLVGNAPHTELTTVTWGIGVTCPDGTVVSGGGAGNSNGCDYSTRMTPIP